MFSIAICDDEELVCQQIEKYLELYIEQKKVVTEIYYSGERLYKDLSEGIYYDVIFLDIQLKNMNGVELGSKIREYLKNEYTHIVYISSFEEYALELFKVRPLNFIIKPINKNDIIEIVKKAMALTEKKGGCYTFQTKNVLYRIPFHEIMFIESNGRKISLYTVSSVHEAYEKLDSIEKCFPISFLRIHKSYLVNELYIKQWKYEQIILSDGKELPISKPYRKAIRKMLLEG